MEKRTLKPELIESGDGSHTLRVAELKEHYHSHKGALRESLHVFIEMGLKQLHDRPKLRVLEVGFGTGLNALLTCLEADRPNVSYLALETFPLSMELLQKLNYPSLMKHDMAAEHFASIHQADWDREVLIIEDFNLEKRHCALQEFNSEHLFDLVYYDAFAPHAQPELWEPAIWEKLFSMMATGALLVTYCAKGQVRRDMQSAGFDVERLPGPPGKREMIRARKNT